MDGTRVSLLCTPVHSLTCCVYYDRDGGGEEGGGGGQSAAAAYLRTQLLELAHSPAGDVWEGNETGAALWNI